MINKQKCVEDFHRAFGLTVQNVPAILDDKDQELRVNLINEEAKEFEEASKRKDLVEIADAIADLLYVVYGAAVSYGIDTDSVFEEVHRSNMTKIWEDGIIRRRDDGKIIKPPTYSKADIEAVLQRCISNQKIESNPENYY